MGDISVLEKFSKDDVYKHFLTEDFDVKIITSAAVQLVAVTEHLAKLSTGIVLLNREIHTQVVNHYKNLLSQATKIETLEVILQKVHSKIQVVLTSAKRLCKNVIEPYELVSDQTVLLSRLQTTCDILRRIIRVMLLCRKLDKLLSNTSVEFVNASRCINELDYLSDGVDLTGISIIENDLQLISKAKTKIRNEANDLLLNGMKSGNDAEVAIALEVFCNLQTLRITLEETLQKIGSDLTQRSKNALDIQRLSIQSSQGRKIVHGPGRAVVPNVSSFRQMLWLNMEELLKHINVSFKKVAHLYSVLIKKTDAPNCICFTRFLSLIEIQGFIKDLWLTITKTLTDEFSRSANESSLVKQEFEMQFPKLLCIVNDLFKDLKNQGIFVIINEYNSHTKDSGGTEIPEDSLRNALSPFESAYLSRCLSRLTDSVNVVFTGEGKTAPTVADIEGIIKVMEGELVAASVDPLLQTNIAKNIGETVSFIVEKCQYLVCIDGNAVQIINVPNSHQVLNAKVIHLLHTVQVQLEDILSKTSFTKEGKDAIQSSLPFVTSLLNIVMEPLFVAISSAIEAIIVTIHKEDFSAQLIESNTKAPEGPCSLYMKELQQFIMRVQNDYFSLYPSCAVVNKGIQGLACRTIELFVRHVSLIRPLGDGGKMRVAADCAQMEMAVTPFCQRVGDLGKPYRLLRSFRPLLFQTPQHILSTYMSSNISDIVPYSVAINLLFSKAPLELHSPYVTAGWSLEEYAQWLEKHPSEKERLVLIKGTLKKYANWISKKQTKEFCIIYPVIFDMVRYGLNKADENK